jgi:hypothetical protein
MQAEVMKSLNLAVAVFLNGEAALARRLVARKMLISEMENRAADHSFQHLRERRGEDGSADDYHLRILRDLKRIHSLVAALAYPFWTAPANYRTESSRCLKARVPSRTTQPRINLRTDRVSLDMGADHQSWHQQDRRDWRSMNLTRWWCVS